MKFKIQILLLLFILSSVSSFAIIDIKENDKNETIQDARIGNFSKDKKEIRNWFGKKKIKKGKFRLRDLFTLKKQIKKAKRSGEKKFSISAILSAVFGVLGTALAFLVANTGVLALLLLLAGLILGIVGLRAIKKRPDELKGKAFAWAGILIPVLWALIILVLIAFFSFFIDG